MRDDSGQGADLGATEREIILQRQKKAEALRALGVNPFGNGQGPRNVAAELVRRYREAPADEIAKDPGAWSLGGRVLAVRSFGKAAFLRCSDVLRATARVGGAHDDARELIRAVRLVFVAVGCFAAAAGWIMGSPLPIIAGLIIVGIDVVETTFLLLVTAARGGSRT